MNTTENTTHARLGDCVQLDLNGSIQTGLIVARFENRLRVWFKGRQSLLVRPQDILVNLSRAQ